VWIIREGNQFGEDTCFLLSTNDEDSGKGCAMVFGMLAAQKHHKYKGT
jgi:hypothetical protein